MVTFNTKFKPVTSDPTVDDCIKSMRMGDYAQMGGCTVASWGFGFMVGRPARFAMAGLMAGIGFTFGSLVMIQNTRGRLMGFRENQRELDMWAKKAIAEGSTSEEVSAAPVTLDWRKYN